MAGLPILSLVVFMPLVGVLVLLFVPGTRLRAIRWIALLAALASLVASLALIRLSAGRPGVPVH